MLDQCSHLHSTSLGHKLQVMARYSEGFSSLELFVIQLSSALEDHTGSIAFSVVGGHRYWVSRPCLVDWRPSLVGWRPSLLGVLHATLLSHLLHAGKVHTTLHHQASTEPSFPLTFPPPKVSKTSLVC